MKKRIVLVESHVSVRDMLAFMLEREGYAIEAAVGSVAEAFRACAASRPDLVLLELMLPGPSGLELLRHVRLNLRRTRVLVYSATESPLLIRMALQAGAHGFVDKTQDWTTLRKALAALARGHTYFAPEAGAHLRALLGASPREDIFTPREVQLMKMVAEGLTTKEAAGHLGISPKTAEKHRENLMAKLRVRGVAGVTRQAIRLGLVGT